ncbi:MAG: GatB/YqeY domain-containing protein [Anaerolineales bacterium]|nr:GatB/YqeY domain-containing protein [Anaerolineales bacterium]
MIQKEALENELKESLRSGDKVRLRTIRMILSSVKLAEVDKGEALDDAELTAIIQKEAKSRREAIEEAEQAGREDLILSNQEELSILEGYLPEPLSEDEIEDMAREAAEEVGAEDPGDMGKVMKILMPRVQGRADGGTVSRIVRKVLSEG